MTGTKLLFALVIMAGVTYLIRLLPLTFFRKKITNPYIKSFLNFVPYAVLGALTFPDVIFATGNVSSAVAGVLVALILSYFERGLLTVSVAACFTVYVVNLII